MSDIWVTAWPTQRGIHDRSSCTCGRRRAAFDKLRKVLARAQEERGDRPELIRGAPAWITYEREVMTGEVNRIRSGHGLSPVSMTEIERAEQQGCGHVDYSKKWALYCAELATPTTTRPGDVRGTDHTKGTGDE